MSKLKFKLNESGVRALLQSKEMQAVLSEKAAGVQRRSGDGFAYDVQVGKKRAVARVKAVTKDAKRETLENNTLLKAVGG